MDETDCSRLLEVVKQVSEIGGHLAITRETIPNGVGRLLRNSSFAISHHSILVEVFLTVSDYYGLSSVRSTVSRLIQSLTVDRSILSSFCNIFPLDHSLSPFSTPSKHSSTSGQLWDRSR